MFSFKKSPTNSSALSEFMRNGSAREHKRVFKKVIEESIKEQQKIIDQAGRINAAAEHRCDSGNDWFEVSDAEVPGITSQADAYVKTHHKAITGQITEAFDPENAPVSLFMAGSPGAGKTEASLKLLENTGNILRIDADELRCHFNECGYTGTNSHLFQKPVSKLVHKIHDAALKKKISFLLDGTFSNESIARQNIQRSLKRERKVFIIFVYQAPQKAWHFVQQREKVEGRRIRSEDFAEKFCESQKVANKMKAEFEKKVILSLLCKNIDGTNKFYRKSIERIEDHITEKYSAEKIRDEIPGWDDLSSLVRWRPRPAGEKIAR